MCGIAGYLTAERASSTEEMLAVARNMASQIAHRGPDAEGSWASSKAGVALSHRRLSIIDLDARANQPMLSADGRFVLVFNGELYNYRALRGMLEQDGPLDWRTNSDTETLLMAIQSWGLKTTLERANGMFAFGLFDNQLGTLKLVRDRLGKKPLYYGLQGDSFLFGSELRALRVHPDWRGAVNPDSVAEFLRYGYVPTPLSVFTGISKLPAATILTVSAENLTQPQLDCYWDAAVGAVKLGESRKSIDYDELRDKLNDAVALRLVSDVPVGSFLSGGVDSSLVTAIAVKQNETGERLRTFTIGFDDSSFDESAYARTVSKHLGTEHHELTVCPQDMLDLAQNLSAIYDEPFSDVSQIPTALVARFASEHVKVVLSGDGGDEAFLGYTRYSKKLSQWRKVSRVPMLVRKLLGACASGVGEIAGTGRLGPAAFRRSYDAQRAAALLSADDLSVAYRNGVSACLNPARFVRSESDGGLGDTSQKFMLHDGETQRSLGIIDQQTYLPDDILTKVDRATMAYGLEARAPLLDYRLIEMAWALQLSDLIDSNRGKLPLWNLLYEHLPQQQVDRPKQGFGVPLVTWLRGPLESWAESVLYEPCPMLDSILNAREVAAIWRSFMSGQNNVSDVVWNLIVLKLWGRAYS